MPPSNAPAFTPEWDWFLVRSYGSKTAAQVATELGVETGRVESRIKTLRKRGRIARKRRDLKSDEPALRRLCAQGLSWVRIGARLRRTEASVRRQAKRLGIEPISRPDFTYFTPSMDAHIVANYEHSTARQLAADLDLPLNVVESRLRVLQARGELARKRRDVSGDEELLRALHAQGVPWSGIAARLGREEGAVREHGRRLGLPSRMPFRRSWEDETDLLIELYPTTTAAAIAARLGRKPKNVEAKIRAIGLRKRSLAPRAQHLLWEMREVEGAVDFLSARLNQSREAVEHELARLEQAGGPDPLPEPMALSEK